MKWDVFVQILLNGDFNHVTNMSLNLIAGGFSLDIDYMYVACIPMYSITSE